MTDPIEDSLAKILNCVPLTEDDADICDFSLEEQNAALESQGITPSTSSKHKPVLGQTVNYIVAVVLFNEHEEVLMIQEAKESCAGKWYLPAGRVERGEIITTAAVREVLEETGLNIDCTTMLMVEAAGGEWIRFVLTGKVKGGTLKTPAQADKESLQAKWINNIEELSLRAKDITHLIERARWYYSAMKTKEPWHPDMLPICRGYEKLLMRLVIVIKKRSTNRTHILASERTAKHLPTCEIHPTRSLHSTLRRFMIEIFGAEVAQHKPHGLLAVEHDPRQGGKDGACLTLLVSFRNPLEDVPIIGKYIWQEVSMDLEKNLLVKVSSRNEVFQLHVIR